MILGNEGCCAEGKGGRVVVKFVTWSVVVARGLGFMVSIATGNFPYCTESVVSVG